MLLDNNKISICKRVKHARPTCHLHLPHQTANWLQVDGISALTIRIQVGNV